MTLLDVSAPKTRNEEMRKRIAIIFDEDIYCQRGRFNAVRNRVKHLKDIADFDIDVFVIGTYSPWHVRQLRHTEKKEKVKSIVLDGITYNALWHSFSLIDYFLEVKLHRSPVFSRLFYRRLEKRIHGYNLVSAHSTRCGLLASRLSSRDHIPFCVTWHGSDIHTIPSASRVKREEAERVINAASCNFFVSANLLSVGLSLAPNMRYELLYNGKNDLFQRYSAEKRDLIRQKYGVLKGTKVIAFAGHLMEVKNPQLLAPIFAAVQHKYGQSLSFWVIGSGKMQNRVEEDCKSLKVDCKFWGSQPADKMPEFMNCIDVLVLPSRNEGLPLVAVEAIACGANVVGSDVGGISEAIGSENVFPLGDAFIDGISDRIVQMLTEHINQPLRDVFDWKKTAKKELDIYDRLLGL